MYDFGLFVSILYILLHKSRFQRYLTLDSQLKASVSAANAVVGWLGSRHTHTTHAWSHDHARAARSHVGRRETSVGSTGKPRDKSERRNRGSCVVNVHVPRACLLKHARTCVCRLVQTHLQAWYDACFVVIDVSVYLFTAFATACIFISRHSGVSTNAHYFVRFTNIRTCSICCYFRS